MAQGVGRVSGMETKASLLQELRCRAQGPLLHKPSGLGFIGLRVHLTHNYDSGFAVPFAS